MGVILDTSILIQAEKQEFEIDKFTRNREEEIFGLSVITVTEILHGVHRADSTKRRFGSTALCLGFSVATYNKRRFERIEGLTIEISTFQKE